MGQKKVRYFVGDFETVVEEDTDRQEKTAVWSSAYVELFDTSEHVYIDGNIRDTYYFLETLDSDVCMWYHNLKFDGEFWINFLFQSGYTFKHCTKISKRKFEQLKSLQFDCLMSSLGQMYWIRFRTQSGHLVELRDSLKLIPMSLRVAGDSFKTKHRKLDMEYKGNHYPDCPIIEKERDYIKNDVLVMKEIMELMISDGHKKLTIGGCCMQEFKQKYDRFDWNSFFPNLKKFRLHPRQFPEMTAENFCRQALRGGWTYLMEEYADRIVKHGFTFDVNSLYPSVMHSASGNYYPVGDPQFFVGRPPAEAYANHHVFIVKISCDFELKKGFVPTIQLKNDFHYDKNEYLKTSKIKQKDNTYSNLIYVDGELKEYRPTFYLTNVDLELFLRHYHVKNLKYISGCWFRTEIGLFDDYINKYFEQKKNSKGGKRAESKLFLNNLWGKFSTSDDSSYKEPIQIDGVLSWHLHTENLKNPVYVPIGCFVTAYARKFTITAAQANYDKFVYADTDSLHMLDTGSEVKGIVEHDTELLCWKKESNWVRARFLHSKTYIEECEDYKKVKTIKGTKNVIKMTRKKECHHTRIVKNDDMPMIKKKSYILKCCGMPDNCKDIFLKENSDPVRKFQDGLSIHGKLVPRHIEGGIVLVETDFTIKESYRFN